MRSQFASLRVLTLPGGVTSGTRIVIDGITGEIRFYNAANQLIGYLSPDRWYTGLADGAHAQLDPFGGLRIYDADGHLAIALDAAGGLQIRDPDTGLIVTSLGEGGLHIEDPSALGLDIDIINGAAGNTPAPRAGITTAVTPGTTSTTPAVVQFTAADLELRHVAVWTNGSVGAQSFTPPAGYTEALDVNSSGDGATLGVTIASRQPAVPNAVRTFTSTFGLWQFDLGQTIVVRGTPGGTAPSVLGVSQAFTVDPAPAATQHLLSLAPPPGVLAGHVLIAFVMFGNDGGGIPTSWSIPTGWHPLAALFSSTGAGPGDSTLAGGAWYKIATASEPATYDVAINSPGVATKKFHAAIVAVADAGVIGNGPDIRIGGRSLPRGYVAGFTSTVAQNGITTGSVIMSFSADVIAGRRYELHLHFRMLASAGSEWEFDARVAAAVVDRLWDQSGIGPLQRLPVDGTIEWTATTTGTFTFDVLCQRTAGAGTFDAETAGGTRSFRLTDVGF